MAQTTHIAEDLLEATGEVGDWLDLRTPETDGPDTDGRYLRQLRELVTAGAPEPELINAVKRARAAGWSWTPIAIVLDCTRNQTIRRFSRAIGHPAARRKAPSPR
jgi:hypothetical protein